MSDAQSPEPNYCQGLTNKKLRCSRKVPVGQQYCFQHAQGWKAKWRALNKPAKRTGTFFMAALTIAGFLIALPSSVRPYPWFLPVTEIPDGNKIIRKVALHVYVRDTPMSAEQKRGVATMSSLDNLHVTVDEPISVDPKQNSWRSCTVLDFHVPEWNNDSASRPLAELNLEKDTTILRVHATASNGQWTGAVSLKRLGDGSTLVREVALRGSLVSHWWQSEKMSVDETHDGKSVRFTTDDIFPLTTEKLIKYGVPVLNATNAHQQCSEFQQ